MTVFPSPNHDHAHCADRLVRHAEAVCRRRGARLTAQRARVLEVLAQGHQPMGAYEIMDALAEDGRRPAPITVYRALDFLVAHGLAHRIESRNAFIACMAGESGHDAAVFLICRHCGNVGETLPEGVHDAVDRAAAAQGFRPDFTVIEIDGLCRHCASTGEEAVA
jgi:Fur family transcriptional regulator, zinc uptake regulator